MNTKLFQADIEDLKVDKGGFNKSLNLIKNSSNIENPLISILIPLYNEEFSIKNIINMIPNHRSIEIIIVDDGSTDNSVRTIKEINNKNIKLIQHDKNQGYGASILTGLKHVTGDIVVTMDSDGQHNPEEIPNLIKPIINNQADFVVGSRYLGSSKYKVPLHTRVGEYFINLCLWLLYHQKIRNNQGGFRAFRKENLKFFKNLNCTGMGFTTELLFKAAYKKLRITEIPITLNSREDGLSYVRLIKVFKSISFSILLYAFKKFNLDFNHFFKNKIIKFFYSKIKHKKIFQ